MYGSSLMLVTRMLRDSRIAAREAAAIPLPREDTTPPVTKTYFAIYLARVGMDKSTGRCARRKIFRRDFPSIDAHPLSLDPIVGAVHDLDVLAHRPRNDLPVQRDMVDLRVVLGDRLGNDFLPLGGVGFDARGVDQRVELGIAVVAPVVVAGAFAVRAVQHRLEDRLRVGHGAAPAEQVGAGVALGQPGEIDSTRLRV